MQAKLEPSTPEGGTRETSRLLYLYGIVPVDSPEPPEDLPGLDSRPVSLRPAAGMRAVVSEVDGERYAAATLDRHLRDLEWVGERALAHERVLTWYVEKGPVIPLTLFSLHRDESRLQARLEKWSDRLHRLMGEIEGRSEWGVKVWRDDTVLEENLDRLSDPMKSIRLEIDAAGPGRGFLLERKRDELKAREMQSVSGRVAREIFRKLREQAERGTLIPLAKPSGEEVPRRRLVLHSAFLVADDGFEPFHEGVSESALDYRQMGFDFELAGPLPPYHFAKLE